MRVYKSALGEFHDWLEFTSYECGVWESLYLDLGSAHWNSKHSINDLSCVKENSPLYCSIALWIKFDSANASKYQVSSISRPVQPFDNAKPQ